MRILERYMKALVNGCQGRKSNLASVPDSTSAESSTSSLPPDLSSPARRKSGQSEQVSTIRNVIYCARFADLVPIS